MRQQRSKFALLWCLAAMLAAVGMSGCVSQRVVKGEEQPAQRFNAKEAAQTRLALGLEYLQNNDFQQAKFNLEKALEYAPDNADVQLGLAYYYQRADNPDTAAEHYQKALRLAPQNGDVLNNYGVLECSRGRYQAADELFRKALQVKGYFRMASTYENAADCAVAAEQPEQALQYYEQAVNFDPQNSTMLERYAGLLLDLQRPTEARQVLRQRARLPELSATYLWLEVRTAKALNQPEQMRYFAGLLRERFPNSRYQQQLESL